MDWGLEAMHLTMVNRSQRVALVPPPQENEFMASLEAYLLTINSTWSSNPDM